MKYFLSIAASDSSSGAGIQQDNAVANLLGFHPLNVVTAITAQSFNKVYDVFNLDAKILTAQFQAIVSNFPIDVCKVGVLTTLEHIEALATFFNEHSFKIIVVDPVFRSTSGWQFLDYTFISHYKTKILPLASFITPNKFELECLCNKKIEDFQQATDYAAELHQQFGCGIYIKGGHFDWENNIIHEALIFDNKIEYITKQKLSFSYTHGTGCAFSTAFACYLYSEKEPLLAAQKATEFVSKFFEEKNKSLTK